MIELRKISHKKLAKLLLESDNVDLLEEMARRINLGLIPLAEVGFSKLSNKKLKRLETMTLCDWSTRELCQRQDAGKIPSKTVTIEEVIEQYRQARNKFKSQEEKKAS